MKRIHLSANNLQYLDRNDPETQVFLLRRMCSTYTSTVEMVGDIQFFTMFSQLLRFAFGYLWGKPFNSLLQPPMSLERARYMFETFLNEYWSNRYGNMFLFCRCEVTAVSTTDQHSAFQTCSPAFLWRLGKACQSVWRCHDFGTSSSYLTTDFKKCQSLENNPYNFPQAVQHEKVIYFQLFNISMLILVMRAFCNL